MERSFKEWNNHKWNSLEIEDASNLDSMFDDWQEERTELIEAFKRSHCNLEKNPLRYEYHNGCEYCDLLKKVEG